MRSKVLTSICLETSWGPVWRIRRHEEVRRYLADSRFQPFRPANPINMLLAEGRFEDAYRARDETESEAKQSWSLSADGTDDVSEDASRTLRLQIMSALAAPANVRRRTAQMTLLAQDVVEAFARLKQPASLSGSYSTPFCARAMCVLLGVSTAESQSLAVQADEQDPVAINGIANVAVQVRKLIARRRDTPHPDVISELLATEQGQDLRFVSRLANVLTWVLMPSNWEVPAAVIDSGVSLLIAHSRQRHQLEADPALYPSAVEEILRLFKSPEIDRGGLVRYTTANVSIDDTEIPRGAFVQFDIGAANRDEQIFPHPMEFDITRNPNPHLTFGIGPHMCRFIPMSRSLINIGIMSVLREFPELRQVQSPAADRTTSHGARPSKVWISW